MIFQERLKILCMLAILTFALSVPLVSAAAEKADTGGTRPAGKTQETKEPALSQVIPSVVKLDEQLNDLKKQMVRISDLSSLKENLTRLADRENEISKRWSILASKESPGYNQFLDVRLELETEAGSLKKASESLTDRIEKVVAWRKKWSNENQKWTEWRIGNKKYMTISFVKRAFVEAQQTIDEALSLTSQEIQPLLETQQNVAKIQSRIQLLSVEMDALFGQEWETDFEESAPSFFSSSYFSQITGKGLWHKMVTASSSISWPDAGFFVTHGWIMLAHVLLALILSVGVFHRRDSLKQSEKWHFLATRPFSLGIFVGIIALVPFYSRSLPSWNFILSAPGAIAFSRLVGATTPEIRKRRLVYCLAALFILTKFFHMIQLAPPLFRLVVFFVALMGLFFCIRDGLVRPRHEDPVFYRWLPRLGAVVFLVILIAAAGGYSSFALRLFESSLRTVFLLLMFQMFLMLARGALEFAVSSKLSQKIPIIRNNAPAILPQAVRILDLLLGFILVSIILSFWGVYANPPEAVKGILSLGFTVGSLNITLGLIIGAAVLLYGSFIASWSIQALLLDEVLPKRQMDRGVQISITRLIHYALVLLGFILALMALGLEFTNLTILGGAFGVGLGFGLQAIVNNFASGLILLFERPVKIGDTIELADQWGVIKKLGLRATVVQTYDNAEIVVPNSDLITNQVTNWTLAERRIRLKFPVGVAYGSDVPLVMKILMECTEEHALVLKNPAPQVLFMGFGDSSLDFEVRVWIADFTNRRLVHSELHQEIDQRFRQSDVEIPFPQRDLHLRTMDKSVASSLKGETTQVD